MAFSLPRKRLAAFTATWPRIWLLESMIHHLRGTSLAFAENVFIRAERARKLRVGWGGVNCLLNGARPDDAARVRTRNGTAVAYNCHKCTPLSPRSSAFSCSLLNQLWRVKTNHPRRTEPQRARSFTK